MSRFASGARRLHVFDCKRRSLRIDVPRNVAVEHEFNTVITKDETKDRWPEARLAQLDGAVVACLDKLERGEPLTREERWYISFFVGFAETRGKGFRDSVRALSSGERIVPEAASGPNQAERSIAGHKQTSWRSDPYQPAHPEDVPRHFETGFSHAADLLDS
jgi:Protein of unknown function (DUF4238)